MEYRHQGQYKIGFRPRHDAIPSRYHWTEGKHLGALNNYTECGELSNVQQQLIFNSKSLIDEVMALDSGKRIRKLTRAKLLHQF